MGNLPTKTVLGLGAQARARESRDVLFVLLEP
jgi:hypothetical protein